jgi:hypothetical protein
MPVSSIDMFFACSLVVSVALVAMAFVAGTMQTQINSMQDLNQESYLKGLADHLVSSYGAPENWGSTLDIPVTFGLSSSSTNRLYDLDADKISRLNSQNQYALPYLNVLKAAKINNIAFGVSVSQMLAIEVLPSGNSTVDDVTAYTFQVSVSQDAGPVRANLHCYALANSFLTDVSAVTSSAGTGSITVNIPTSYSGSALLVVFARASFDDRLCAYNVYSFAHQSDSPQPNLTFLGLSPLNNTLDVQLNYPAVTVENVCAFSYAYSANVTPTSSTTYAIPDFVDKSPTVLVAQGVSGTFRFGEWVSYPSVPLTFGDDFSNSAVHVFIYTVTINDALYRLTLRFGDLGN